MDLAAPDQGRHHREMAVWLTATYPSTDLAVRRVDDVAMNGGRRKSGHPSFESDDA
jgi:hypothetical protein